RGYDAHEAQDLTQDFFAHLFEKDALRGVSSKKGRFRSFLLASLNNQLSNYSDKQHSLKRGGGRQLISFEACQPEEFYRSEPVENQTPERLFERRWALRVIERALARLKSVHAAPRDGAFFEIARPYLTAEADAETRSKLAAELGMTEGAFKVALHRFRRQF